ncbi:MAG: outer membrane protein [Bryobacteraceae bacterium]
MKRYSLTAAVLALLAGDFAQAQNSDFGILLGVSLRTSAVVSPGRVESSMGASVQLNYAAQLHEAAAGRLYLELPLLIAADSRGAVTTSIQGSKTTTVFFTPGVRFHRTIHPRVALYGAAGGGIASLARSDSVVGVGIVSSRFDRTTSAALGFGGGLDFRLTRLLSLRAEGRDFITKSGLGGERGRSHAFFTAGVGFHF